MPDPNVPTENTDTDQPAGPADAGSSGPDDPDAPGFLNRAARRSRGRGAGRGTPEQPAQGKGKSFGGRGSVQGPRQWGNRRSG